MKKKVSNSIFARGIRFFLHQTEKWVLMNSRKQLQNPPVFIMGPPRSGTTLLYQLLTQTCHFSYFSEFAASYNTFPFLATYLKKKHFGKDNQSFKSDFGRPRGLFAPSEAGEIWNRWFPAEYKESYNYVDENHLDEKQKKHIYQLVSHIEGIIKAPFINKNVKNSVRIKAINSIFPDALFIEVYRDPLDNAASIWDMRHNLPEDPEAWLSVMPKEINKIIDENIYNQIAGQIHFIRKDIREDIQEIGESRIIRVKYEDLCRNPLQTLEKLEQFLRNHSCIIQRKKDHIQGFKVSNKFDSLSNDVKNKLKMAVERYAE